MNKNTNTPFLDKILQQPEKPRVINGKDVRYTGVYLLRSFQCQNCQMLFIIPPDAILWKQSAVEMQQLGEDLHLDSVRKAKKICANPKLIIVWDNAYVLTELLK